MIKPLLTFLLLLIFFQFANAQNFLFSAEPDLKMSPDQREVLKPTKLVFSNHIYDLAASSIGNHLLIQLRNTEEGNFTRKGSISFFNPFEKKEVWGKKINYVNEGVYLTDSLIFFNSISKCQRLSLLNGKEMWKRDGNVFLNNSRDQSILATLQGSQDYQNMKIRSYQIQSGATKWEAKLRAKEGFSGTYRFDSLHIATIGTGVHMTNIETGHSWSYNTLSTTQKDYSYMAGKVAGAIAVGLLTGMVMVGPMADLVYGIHSNLAYSDPYLYLAGAEALVKINKPDGSVAWTHPLNKLEMSSSDVFTKQDRLFFINTGFAKQYGYPKKFGKPFLAALDLENGIEIFKRFLPETKEGIVDWYRDSTSLYFLFSNEIRKYNLDDGTELGKMAIESNKSSYPVGFETRPLYQISDSAVFTPVFKTDQNALTIRMSTGDIIATNDDLETKTILENGSFFRLYKQYSPDNKTGIRIFTSGKSSVVTDFSNQRLVEMENTRQFKIWNNLLLVTAKNFLYTMDVSNYFSPTPNFKPE